MPKKYSNINIAYTLNVPIRDKIITITNIINKRRIKACWYAKLIRPEDVICKLKYIMEKDKSLSELEAIEIIRRKLDNEKVKDI